MVSTPGINIFLKKVKEGSRETERRGEGWEGERILSYIVILGNMSVYPRGRKILGKGYS